ncbi:MAG: hypothetical protein JST01_06190 [Cyanobacteria bacterium SZAS TMP-1]|nr:hypothetical protein [Cyanobacteria bacterium SZAS TMP-1]
MSIPLLLVCDGDESKQATLEGLVKNEPGLKYIATVSMQEGTRAVERAMKVGARLIWIDLDEEPVEGLNLLSETRKLYPSLNVIVSRRELDADMVKAALQLGALDFLDPSRAAQQLNVVVENMKAAGQGQSSASHANLQAAAAPQQAAAAAGSGASIAQGAGNGTGGGKWGNLDAIPTPGAKAAPQDVTGEIHVANSGIQNLVASQGAQAAAAAAAAPQAPAPAAPAPAPAAPAPQAVHPTAELPAGGSKWGDLDSIGTPAAAAAPAAPAPAAPTPAAPAPAPAPAAPAAPAPAPAAPAAAAPAATPSGTASTGGSKWGDLDAIPTPKAVQEPAAARPTGEMRTPTSAGMDKPLSALDAIPTPSDKPAIPMPKPQPHGNTNKALRPSPEKAELYSMGSPVMMSLIIIIIIFAAIAFMMLKSQGHH